MCFCDYVGPENHIRLVRLIDGSSSPLPASRKSKNTRTNEPHVCKLKIAISIRCAERIFLLWDKRSLTHHLSFMHQCSSPSQLDCSHTAPPPPLSPNPFRPSSTSESLRTSHPYPMQVFGEMVDPPNNTLLPLWYLKNFLLLQRSARMVWDLCIEGRSQMRGNVDQRWW